MTLVQNRALKKIFGPKEVIKKRYENRVKVSLITLTPYYCYSGDKIKDKVSSMEENINLYMFVVGKPKVKSRFEKLRVVASSIKMDLKELR